MTVTVDTGQSEAAQMEANAHQDDQVVKSKEAEAPILEHGTELKQELENAQNAKDIINGEC